MRRAAIIALAAVSIIAAALAMIAAYIMSPAGRGALATFAERRIERVVGGEVEIGALTGNLTRRIELNNIKFLNDGKDWASIRQATMDWSLAALFSRRVEISAIEIEDAVVIARPPVRERKEPFKGFELPESLPDVSIDRIALRNVQVAGVLSRQPLRLDGEASVAMGGAALSISAWVKEARDRDNIAVEISRGSDAEAPALKVRVSSAPDGALPALLKSEGSVQISADGKGPLTAYRAAISAELGEYGSLSGGISSDLTALDEILFDFTASPGERFKRLAADLGEEVTAAGALAPQEGGARIRLQRLSGAFGGLGGQAEWRNGERALDSADVELQAAFAPGWRPALQDALGEKAVARISLKRQGRDYKGQLSVTSPVASARIEELSTDLRARFSGPVTATLSDRSGIARRFRTSFNGEGSVSFAASDVVILKNARIFTENGAFFDGDAALRFAGQEFEIDGKIAAKSSAIAAFIPAITPSGDASGAVKANGTLKDFGLNLDVKAPQFQVGESLWAASSISVSLENLPLAPTGDYLLKANDGSLHSSARIRREAGGAIALSGINYRGEGFALTGDAAFNPATREGAVDLRYAGEGGAEPWPGLMIAGEATAKGALARNQKDNRIEFRASSLRTKSVALEDASLKATGVVDRLAFEASAASVSVQDRLRAERLKLAGTAAIAERVALTLASASADVQGETTRLLRPAIVSFGGGVAIDDLALRIGEKGSADFSGAFSAARWRADAAIKNLAVSVNGATIGFDLALDTNKSTAAEGAFSAASGHLGAVDRTLRGEYSWDGRRLTVSAGGGESALTLDLDFPLALRRANRLSVSTTGALEGTARYDGRAETIAHFLPQALHSLEGDLAFDGALGGTVKEPRVTGALSLTDGTYTEAISGLSIVDIDLTSSAAATTASSSVSFRGTASGAGQTAKTITADGRLTLRDGVTIAAEIGLQGARFSAGPVQRVDATGTLNVAGNASDFLVSGDVSLLALEARLFTPENLGLVDINVVAVGEDGAPALDAVATRQRTALRYAVRIEADDNIIVSGRGLDSEWRTSAQIAGTSNRPLVLGTMNLNRGDLEFSGRRFDLTRGSIGFDTLAPNDPTIDIRAERETRDGTTVAVVITGRSSALKVSLESTPSLPNEDVMALILFDKPADELSAFQSLQVADALTQLGGVGEFGGKGFTGAAREALGLDLLNIDVDQADSSASLLTVGKYVTDGLFVSASQNARGENGSLRIEYEIGQSFSVETELRQDGDQTISANWKKDF
jgi:autotransporter translocation and assembly factor TamB